MASNPLMQRQLAHMNRMDQLAAKDKAKAAAAAAKQKTKSTKTTSKSKKSTTQTESVATAGTPTSYVSTPAPRKQANAYTATGQHLRLVVDFLRANRNEYTPEQLFTELSLDPRIAESLETALRNNPKLYYSPATNTYTYQAQYRIHDIDGLRSLFRPDYNPFVIDREDLKDSYIGVEQDIETLKQERHVLAVPNPETKSEIFFYNDPKYDLQIDKQLRALWDEAGKRMKRGTDLEEAMKKVHLRPLETQESETDKIRRKRKFDDQSDKKGSQRARQLKMKSNQHMLGEPGSAPTVYSSLGLGGHSAVTNQRLGD